MAKQLSYPAMREIFTRFQAPRRSRRASLEHVNAFTLWSRWRCRRRRPMRGEQGDAGLFAVADTPEKMLALGRRGADRAYQDHRPFPQQGQERHQAEPHPDRGVWRRGAESSRAALQSLPGVGRKTANVVLNMWFRQPAQAVDTHIFRVGNRTGIAPGKDVETAVERAIEDNVPAEFQLHAHHWLILHGRYICVARKAKCGICPDQRYLPV
jgi:endonuclease III